MILERAQKFLHVGYFHAFTPELSLRHVTCVRGIRRERKCSKRKCKKTGRGIYSLKGFTRNAREKEVRDDDDDDEDEGVARGREEKRCARKRRRRMRTIEANFALLAKIAMFTVVVLRVGGGGGAVGGDGGGLDR